MKLVNIEKIEYVYVENILSNISNIFCISGSPEFSPVTACAKDIATENSTNALNPGRGKNEQMTSNSPKC